MCRVVSCVEEMSSSTFPLRASPRAAVVAGLVLLLAPALEFVATGAALAGTRVVHVDRRDGGCSDAGNGTAAAPYCSIGAALADVRAGTRIDVESGVYPEAVRVRTSGTSSALIVLQAADGANVTIDSPGTGITASQVRWVTIRGFNVNDPVGYGILVSQSSHITVEDNHVSGAGKPVNGGTRGGVIVKGTTNSLIVGNTSEHNSDSGFAVLGTSTGVRVSGNRSFGNARQYRPAAPGIDIQASGNTIDRNLVYGNEDSGIQLYNGAVDNVVVDNVTYNNGDHGIDALYSPDNAIVSNTIAGNATSGITLESGSGGATIENNIVADNGVGLRGDIWVDGTSTRGTSLNFDLLRQTSAGAAFFTWSGARYTSVFAFRKATGQEGRGKAGDPKFVDRANGNLQLSAGSPAIDSADMSSTMSTMTDLTDTARLDDPSTANSGVGGCIFADRGAYEYVPG
jgi:hypothetical protein